MECDGEHWETLWMTTLRDHPERVAQRLPNHYLVAELTGVAPGRALDAGCGHGAEALWLASHGWTVTAIDFSPSALAHAQATAEGLGSGIAERITWVEADLGGWTPPQASFDLVVCLYVHVVGSVVETVRRMARGVAPGGRLLMVGHRPIDPATGAPTPAAGQVQVSVDDAREALDHGDWDFVVAEDRPRTASGTGVDAVIHAQRGVEEG